MLVGFKGGEEEGWEVEQTASPGVEERADG